MNLYGVGGLTLACESPVPGLRPAASDHHVPPDIALRIERAPPPVADRFLFRWPGRYGLCLSQSGDGWLLTTARGSSYAVSPDGRTIAAFDNQAEADPEFLDVLVRRVLPRIGLLFGRVAFHGAALAKNDAAILLFGGSGAGKSTLAAALAGRFGWDLLSDDISLLHPEGGATVAPAATGVCVWPDSRAALDLPLERCRALPAYGTKIWFDFAQESPRAELPLRALAALDRSPDATEPELQRLSPGEALVLAIHQLIQFNPGACAIGGLEPLVHRLRRTIAGLPAYRLVYPSDFSALPRVAALLEEVIA
ncbi:MAG TPA: hypothetical protein VFW19_05620 [Allosphingosinicella sp.]|nr:hypothetical protein [Allosphingosinicella sp.]